MPRTSRPTAIRSPCSAIARAHHSGRLQRRGAEVDPAAAGGQRRGQRLVVPDAAGQLDVDVERADHPGQQLAVAAPAEGGVEVDQVHPLGAVALPGQRGLERVAVGGLAAGLALHQADGLAVGDVDGGEQLQLRHGDQPRDARPTVRRTRRGRVPAWSSPRCVRRRRMVRDYDPDRPVPPEVRERLLEHAIRAPSAGFSQGWAFLVLETAEERDRFWTATTADGRARRAG